MESVKASALCSAVRATLLLRLHEGAGRSDRQGPLRVGVARNNESGEGRVEGGNAVDTESTRMSRRQALAAGLAVTSGAGVMWATPEILTAKPAEGATLSAPGAVLPGAVPTPPEGPEKPVVQGPHAANPLAFTGLNIERDAEVGAALVAGGWAMHHWAARKVETEREVQP